MGKNKKHRLCGVFKKEIYEKNNIITNIISYKQFVLHI